MLTLGWSDGCSFMLTTHITHSLMLSSNDENVFGITKTYDKRSLVHRRRQQAREKAPNAMVDMIKNAQEIGHYATMSALMESLLFKLPDYLRSSLPISFVD